MLPNKVIYVMEHAVYNFESAFGTDYFLVIGFISDPSKELFYG